MTPRHAPRNDQWDRIKEFLPGRAGTVGLTAKDNRLFVEAVGDVIAGVIGAYVGNWLAPRLGVHVATGLVRASLKATGGAVVLLLLVRLVRSVCKWRRRPTTGGPCSIP